MSAIKKFYETSLDFVTEQKNITWFLLALIILALAYYLIFFGMTIDRPITEKHAFRQTQTAISVYYMLHEGAWFNYLTPVQGAPWTIPFEAPVYQWTVAAVASVTPLTIDMSGRLVSVLYFLGFIAGAALILRKLFPGEKHIVRVFCLLCLTSPLYIFWSRTFLIETASIFYCVFFLLFTMFFVDSQKKRYWVLATVCSSLGVLTKATTWPTFVVAAFLYWCWKNQDDILALRPATLVSERTFGFVRRGFATALIFIIPLILIMLWNHHADALKATSILGKRLTAENLVNWNFGELSMRWSSQLWADTIRDRFLPYLLGNLWALPVFLAVFLFKQRNKLFMVALGIGLGFLPMLLFANLHRVHDYYQAANGAFLLASVSIIIGSLLGKVEKHRFVSVIAMLSLLFILHSQYSSFLNYYYKVAVRVSMTSPFDQITALAKEQVPQDEAILAVGFSWSSAFHYYAERKGIALSFGPKHAEAIMAGAEEYLGDMELGGVADCRERFKRPFRPETSNERLDELLQLAVSQGIDGQKWEQIPVSGCFLYLPAS